MKKIQTTLTVEESKELISRAIQMHPLFKRAILNGSVLLKGGTTVSKISEKLIGQPLRICGRITERGTVSVMCETNDPHSVLIRNEQWDNIDGNMVEIVSALGPDDLVVCSANAFDSKGNAALMAGSLGGGNFGEALSRMYSEGVNILIPVGIEKLVPGDLMKSTIKASRKEIGFSNGMAVGLLPLVGELYTEIEAFKQFGNCEVSVIGSGGIEGAAGSSTFLIEGENQDINNITDVIKNIKKTRIHTSGELVSLIECHYPTTRCRHHEGCSYKSGLLSEFPQNRLGIITIGQSPRIDLLKDIIPMISKKIKIIEKGALDNFNYDEVVSQFSPQINDEVLITRMRDGRQVKIAEKHILPLIQSAIEELEENKCELILLLCTGKFPEFNSRALLLKPQEILPDMVRKLIKNQKLGLLIPDETQINQIYEWWQLPPDRLAIKAGSPYQELRYITEAAEALTKEDVDVIFMDCMGYTKEHGEIVKQLTKKPVIIPRTMIISIINELI